MTMDLLAQGGFDADWIEIIILVLVFGGSAIGAVVKKLIETFSGTEEKRDPGRPRQEPTRPAPPRPTAARRQVQAPPRPQPPARPAQPAPARPIGTQESPAAPPPRPPVRPAQPRESPRVPAPQRGTVEWLHHVRDEERDFDAAVEKRVRHLRSLFERETAQLKRALAHERRQRHAERKALAAVPRTPHEVRRGILLAEILGPPVGLRDPDEHVV